jgi:hypothetical protein
MVWSHHMLSTLCREGRALLTGPVRAAQSSLLPTVLTVTPSLTPSLTCHSLSDLDPEEVMAPRLESLNLFGARHITSADLQVGMGYVFC